MCLLPLKGETYCTKCGKRLDPFSSHDCMITATGSFDYAEPFTLHTSIYHGQERRKRMAKYRDKQRVRRWMRNN